MTSSIHIIGSSKLGGAETFYARLIHGLKARGERVLAVNRPDSMVAKAIDPSVPQFHPAMRNQLDMLSRWQIRRLIHREQPAIVQTYMTRATMATRIKAGSGPVHVARLGGYYKVKRFAHARAWIGNTKGICDFLIRRGLPADRVFYIGNFVSGVHPLSQGEKMELRASMGIPEDAWVITAAGRFIAKKGFDVLLQAFDALPHRIGGRRAHLIIIGDGPLRERLHRQANVLNLASQIHWPGWQTDPGPWLQLSDVHVCPSREEPLGNVILEAWAHQKPVVSSRTPGGRELISDGVNGLLMDVDDAATMSKRIQHYLMHASQRREHATNGYARIRNEFSEAAIINQYLDLYHRLTE